MKLSFFKTYFILILFFQRQPGKQREERGIEQERHRACKLRSMVKERSLHAHHGLRKRGRKPQSRNQRRHELEREEEPAQEKERQPEYEAGKERGGLGFRVDGNHDSQGNKCQHEQHERLEHVKPRAQVSNREHIVEDGCNKRKQYDNRYEHD